MIKMMLISLLMISSAYASPLLRKFSQTGRVDPSESFIKECVVNKDGTTKISMILANGPETTLIKNVSIKKIRLIKVLLAEASSGVITEEPFPCDFGTNTLHGFLKVGTIELDVATNCNSHRINQSPATPKLKSIATKICEF